DQMSANIQAASAELEKTVKSIREAGDEVNRTQTAASATLATVKTALEGIKALSDAAGTAAEGVRSAARDLAQNSNSMATANSPAAAAEKILAAQVSQLNGRVDNVTTTLSASIAGLADRLHDAVGASQQEISATVTDSSAVIARALADGADQIK